MSSMELLFQAVEAELVSLKSSVKDRDMRIAALSEALTEALAWMPEVTEFQRERKRAVAAALLSTREMGA